MSALNIFAHSEWKVEIVIPPCPVTALIRSLISPAALLVKVIAKMLRRTSKRKPDGISPMQRIWL